MPAIEKSELGINDHCPAFGGDVQEECKVLDYVESFGEPNPLNLLGPPGERWEVCPVSSNKTRRHSLACQNKRNPSLRRVHPLDCVNERKPCNTQLVNNLDSGLNDIDFSVGLEIAHHDVEVIGKHHIVGTHDDDDGSRRTAECLAVVSVRAKIDVILFIRDAGIFDTRKEGSRLIARVPVVEDVKIPVLVVLAHHAAGSELHLLDVAVVGQHHID